MSLNPLAVLIIAAINATISTSSIILCVVRYGMVCRKK
jgi:hypothetical protein